MTLREENHKLKNENLAFKLLYGQMKNAIEAFEQRTKNNKMIPKKSNNFKYKSVVESVCEYYDVPQENITNTVRRRNTHIIPRHMVCYIMHVVFRVGYSEIGRMMRKNHATILNGKRSIENLLTYDDQTMNDYLAIKLDLIENKGFSAHNFII
jgi:chromosomal replication initiation ATPase DnaA